jgi:ketosteroid isomerase-like protein
MRIAVSEQGDGAFAVVDVDTLWINRSAGQPFHWKGRACKVYTKVGGRWLFIFQTGVLDYDHWKVIRSESAPMGAGDLS